MSSVYKNACLSIAALGASDDQDGLFWDRESSRPIAPGIVNIRTEEKGESQTLVFERDWEQFGLYRNSHAHRYFGEEERPLLSRAWVVQERLLAPRVVYFGRKQVFWECHTSQCCEIAPHHTDVRAMFGERFLAHDQLDQDAQCYRWKQLIDNNEKSPKTDIYEQLFADWDRIVELYTQCNLTNPADKLVAISGLANETRTRLTALRPGFHRYLAGLWEETLPEALLWVSLRSRGSVWKSLNSSDRLQRTGRVPSWSWASLDESVGMASSDWDREASMTFAFVDSCEISSTGETETGQVTAGSITLTGPTVVAGMDVPNILVHDLDDSKEHGEETQISDWKQNLDIDSVNIWVDLEGEASGELSYLMINGTTIFGNWYCYGLALMKDDQNADVYRRVGLIRYGFSSQKKLEAYVARCSGEQFTII